MKIAQEDKHHERIREAMVYYGETRGQKKMLVDTVAAMLVELGTNWTNDPVDLGLAVGKALDKHIVGKDYRNITDKKRAERRNTEYFVQHPLDNHGKRWWSLPEWDLSKEEQGSLFDE